MQQSNLSGTYNYSLLGEGKMQIWAEFKHLTIILPTEKEENSDKETHGNCKGGFFSPLPFLKFMYSFPAPAEFLVFPECSFDADGVGFCRWKGAHSFSH